MKKLEKLKKSEELEELKVKLYIHFLILKLAIKKKFKYLSEFL